MKYIPCEQGSEQWAKLRAGRPTASEMSKIITSQGKPSKQAQGYAIKLVTEALLGQPLKGVTSTEWMERGRSLEDEAARQYAWEMDVELLPVGFFTDDLGRVGCSPDRLIKDVHAGVELKAPAPHTHVDYRLFGFGADYFCQVQCQLWVAEFEYVDLYSYCPDFPQLKPVRQRFERDEAFIAQMAAEVEKFLAMRDGLLERVRKDGLVTNRTIDGGPHHDDPDFVGKWLERNASRAEG